MHTMAGCCAQGYSVLLGACERRKRWRQRLAGCFGDARLKPAKTLEGEPLRNAWALGLLQSLTRARSILQLIATNANSRDIANMQLHFSRTGPLQAVRALVDHSIVQKQQISADMQQRLLLWVFGMTVSAENRTRLMADGPLPSDMLSWPPLTRLRLSGACIDRRSSGSCGCGPSTSLWQPSRFYLRSCCQREFSCTPAFRSPCRATPCFVTSLIRIEWRAEWMDASPLFWPLLTRMSLMDLHKMLLLLAGTWSGSSADLARTQWPTRPRTTPPGDSECSGSLEARRSSSAPHTARHLGYPKAAAGCCHTPHSTVLATHPTFSRPYLTPVSASFSNQHSLQVWQRMADYLGARLVKTAELDPEQRYVFAAYPHGISAISGWMSFATEATGFSQLFPGGRAQGCALWVWSVSG